MSRDALLDERYDLPDYGLAPHLQRSLTPIPAWAPRERLRRIQGGLPDGKSLPDSLWLRRHRAIVLLLWLHVPAITLFAVVTDSGVRATLSAGGAVAILAASATVAGRKTRNRRFLSTIAALGLLTSSAVIVQVSGGAVEGYFHFFVLMLVLLLYEDWLPYAAAFAYVLLLHGAVGVIGLGAMAHPWRWVAIQALFITAASIACIANWRVNESARQETQAAASRAELSELRFAIAFDNAPIGVALVAPDGRWLNMNHALLHIVGYTRQELLAMDFQAITHPDDLAADLNFVHRVLSGEIDTYTLEKRYIHSSDRVVWVQLDVSLVRDPAGEPLYFISQIQDITNRRQLEEQFRQSQKMEAVGRLAGGVAHDFNNLLTVISGYSELALQRVTDGESSPGAEGVRDDLEEIKSAAGRAASLTQQLLAFSRQQVVRPGKLDVNEIVTEIEKMLDRLIGEDVTLVVRRDPNAGPVEADAGQLEQVILNLAVNGRDAMPEGGTLTIETSAIELEEPLHGEHGRVEPGRYVRLAVTDDGGGMDAETKARVFEPFFTTKELGKGTGLGLSTVYGILEQSGGHVRIQTSPGDGTSFEIYLPECARAETGEPAPAGAGPVGGSETILVIEDEASVRVLTERMLERSGYRVLSAANGSDALLLCAPDCERIDLIVTDVVMPQMRGTEVARRVARIRPDVRVLFMSGYTDNSIDPQTASVSFLQKPFTLDELLDAVRAALTAEPRRGFQTDDLEPDSDEQELALR